MGFYRNFNPWRGIDFVGKAPQMHCLGVHRWFLLRWRLCYLRCLTMAFRPLTARAPSVLLREAKPLKAIFSHAQRLGHLQRLVESQLQPAAREHCHVASWRGQPAAYCHRRPLGNTLALSAKTL